MPLAAFQQNWLLWMTPEWGSKSDPKIGFADRPSPVLRLGDPKQTSGGTGPSDLARRVRLVSDQLALGIRAPCKPCLPQAIPALIQSLLQDDLPQACCSASRNGAMAEHDREADVDGPRPVVENHQQMLSWQSSVMKRMSMDGVPPSGGKPSTDALLSAESARLPLAVALLQITGDVPLRWHTAGDLAPVLVNVRRTIGASCFQYPKECSPVFTL